MAFRARVSPRAHVRALVCGSVALLSGCAPAAMPAPATQPTPDAATPAPSGEPAPHREVSWEIRRGTAPDTLVVSTAAEFTSRVDSIVRVDSAFTELTIAIVEPASGFPRRSIGTLLDVRVRTRGDSLEPVPGVAFPIPFTAEQRGESEQPGFVVPDGTGCGTPSALVQGVRDLWLSLPSELREDSRWRDSTGYRICRDSIPLELSVVREFRVTGSRVEEGVRIVAIERVHHATLRGAGSQFGEAIALDGTGDGKLALELALDGAHVRSATGEATLVIRLVGRRKTQELTQRSRIEIHER